MRSFSRRVVLGVGLALVSSPAVVQAQGTDSLVGTWQLNVAASKYDPGPPPRSATRTVEDRGGGLFVSTQRGIGAQANPTWAHYAFKFDGKEYPYAASPALGTSPSFTTIAFKRVDANTFENTVRQDGKITSTNTYTISGNGKRLTQRQKGIDAKGQPTNNVVVFDRQ